MSLVALALLWQRRWQALSTASNKGDELSSTDAAKAAAEGASNVEDDAVDDIFDAVPQQTGASKGWEPVCRAQ